jgi:hypothetical protein
MFRYDIVSYPVEGTLSGGCSRVEGICGRHADRRRTLAWRIEQNSTQGVAHGFLWQSDPMGYIMSVSFVSTRYPPSVVSRSERRQIRERGVEVT